MDVSLVNFKNEIHFGTFIDPKKNSDYQCTANLQLLIR